MAYIIHKTSRSASTPYSCEPTCSQAGVEAGRIYDDHKEAWEDVKKLNGVNPVGFMVSKYNGRQKQ